MMPTCKAPTPHGGPMFPLSLLGKWQESLDSEKLLMFYKVGSDGSIQ